MKFSVAMLCHYTECPYGKCRVLFIVMPNFLMLSVIMLCVFSALFLNFRGSPIKLFTTVIVEQFLYFFAVVATLVSGEHSSLLQKIQQCWTVLIFKSMFGVICDFKWEKHSSLLQKKLKIRNISKWNNIIMK
jgi:hypothetical protein